MEAGLTPRRFWGLRRPSIASRQRELQESHHYHLGRSAAEGGEEGEAEGESSDSDEDDSDGDPGGSGSSFEGDDDQEGTELLSPGDQGGERQLSARAFAFLRHLQRLVSRNHAAVD